MKKRDLIAAALLVGLVTFVFSDVLFFGQAFYFRDITRFFYPLKKVARDIILSGEFPSWNRFISAGQPLAASPEFAVFYPPNWLLLLPDYFHAFQFHIVVHYIAAALGMYALLRWWKLRIESALFGSIAFALGGVMLSLSDLPASLFAVTWLPFIVLFVSRAVEGNRVRDVALAALFLGLTILSGEPVTSAEVLLMAIVCAVWPRTAGPSLARRAVIAAAVSIGAFLIALVQVIPAADLMRDSVRSQTFSFQLVSTWSTPPLRFAELLLPHLFGSPGGHAALYWGTARYGWLDPFFLGVYFGLLPAALALSALALRRGRWIPVAAALVAGGVLAIGVNTPLLRLLYDARLFASFRYPEKFLVLALIPLTAFAAFAFERIVVGDKPLLRLSMMVTGAAGIVFLLLLIASRSASYPEAFIRFWGIEVHPMRNVMASLSPSAWTSGLLRALVVLLVLLARTRVRPEVWSRLAVAVLAVDLGAERLQVAESIDGRFFTERPAIAGGPLESRLFHQADWYGSTAIARSWFDLPEMYWTIRNGAFPLTTVRWGMETAMNRDIDRTLLLPSADFNQAMLDLRDRRADRWFEPLMAMSAAGNRAMYLPLDGALQRAGGDRFNMQPIIFIPEKTNPLFYFADQVVPCSGRAQFVDLLSARKWSRRAVFTDRDVSTAPGRVLSVRRRSNSADVVVEASGEALLVCSITRHKYWHATLDGREVPLVPVNLAFQGVQVPAGRHQVRLRYRNPLFLLSGIGSLLTLLGTVVAIRSRRDIFHP